MTDTTSHLLTGRGLFLDVEPDVMGEYLPQTDRYDLGAGELLLAPGRRSQHVYIVLAGSLRVHVDSLDEPAVATLGPGACIGEASVIQAIDPSIWVVADEQTHLMVLSHDLLWSLVDASHAFARNLLAALSQRAHPARESLSPSPGKLRRIEEDAAIDALTEAHNRHWLEDMFRRHLKRSRRSGAPTSLVMIDIDRFQAYNERYGHLAGDNALRFVSESLRRHFRPTDIIARFGGDEFAVLLPDTGLDAAAAVADRVRGGFEQDCAGAAPESLKSPITISIGVAELGPGDDLDALIQRASDDRERSISHEPA
ncbi:MAG: GGDEF domain-containing protein [Gammaproteobacteria bacterium]